MEFHLLKSRITNVYKRSKIIFVIGVKAVNSFITNIEIACNSKTGIPVIYNDIKCSV
jgi:hypothetical protein